MTYSCLQCQDYRWVCVNHQAVSWDEGKGCGCGGEGIGCQACNKDAAADPPWEVIADNSPQKEKT